MEPEQQAKRRTTAMLTYLVMFPLILGILAALGAAIEYRAALRTVREPLHVTCPADGHVTEVRIDPRIAARSETFAWPLDLRLNACGQWPARAGCDQRCLLQISPGHTEIYGRTVSSR
jgi:hypothetical protein